jgi:2-polyprenyl-6-methoxyphenol hydroxylase-like FAD-dependent oxidoreductase
MREEKTELLVVGAGPVGLLTALILAEGGVEVAIIDREERTATRSYACALHSRTLRLLQQLGLEGLIAMGRRIRTVAFYDGEKRQAELDLAQLGGDFPFLLVLPQSALEKALEQKLQQKDHINVRWSHRFDTVQQDVEEGVVKATVERLGGTSTGYIVPHWETVVMKRLHVEAKYLVGADGHNSPVRQRLGIEYERVAGPEAFAAIEFVSDVEEPDEVRIVLDDATTNVLWPLPGNRYRWTCQLIHSEPASEFPEKVRTGVRSAEMDEDIRRWVQSVTRRRAPWFSATVKDIAWCTKVAFEHRLAKQFGRDRCWLAGDSAHQTGPVGMQSMNAGLCEAELLTRALQKVLRAKGRPALLEAYDQERQGEWRRLLGLGRGWKPRSVASEWVRRRCARFLP